MQHYTETLNMHQLFVLIDNNVLCSLKQKQITSTRFPLETTPDTNR